MKRYTATAWRMLEIIVVTVGGVFWGMALACVLILLLDWIVR